MKENLLRIRHKCNLYTYLFKSLVSDRFPYNKIGRRRRNMNKKRFCPNFQASTSTSKALFYATLKLEPILKGGLPFPSPFRSFGVCRNTLSANKNANGRKRQSGKEFHLLSSCVMWVVKVNVSFLSSPWPDWSSGPWQNTRHFSCRPRDVEVASSEMDFFFLELLFLEIKRPYLIMGWSHVTLAPP